MVNIKIHLDEKYGKGWVLIKDVGNETVSESERGFGRIRRVNFNTITLRKDINPSALPTAMGQIAKLTRSSCLEVEISLEEGKL